MTMFGLTRWTPFGSVVDMQREMDDLLGRLLSAWSAAPARLSGTEAAGWCPAVEASASEGRLHVRVALPGVDPKDVSVSVTDDVLTIKGERKTTREGREGSYSHRELAYGTFERSFLVPDGVDPGKVEARYANGMLEITMPAPLAEAPRKIDVKIETAAEPKAIKAA
jgi:HSP20 family protein